MMKKILCVGLALADILVSPVDTHALREDSTCVAPPVVTTGGDALNQAVVLKRLGVDCAIGCALGADFWGSFIASRLREVGLWTEWVKTVPDLPTSTSVILIEPSGERHFLVTPGATQTYALWPEEQLLQFDIISIGSLWGLSGFTLERIETLGRFARAADIRLAADLTQDLNGMGRDYLRHSLRWIDYFFPSYIEGIALTGEREPRRILDALATLGPRHVVLKLGAEGCLALVDGNVYAQPSLANVVVDTTGAGDNFVAAYLACVARNLPAPQALRIASLASAHCIAKIGATTARYTFEDLS